jgi:hypothetical protein
LYEQDFVTQRLGLNSDLLAIRRPLELNTKNVTFTDLKNCDVINENEIKISTGIRRKQIVFRSSEHLKATDTVGNLALSLRISHCIVLL